LIWAHRLAEAGLEDSQRDALQGSASGKPSGASGGLVLFGCAAIFVAAILAAVIAMVIVGYVISERQTAQASSLPEQPAPTPSQASKPITSPTPTPSALPTPAPSPTLNAEDEPTPESDNAFPMPESTPPPAIDSPQANIQAISEDSLFVPAIQSARIDAVWTNYQATSGYRKGLTIHSSIRTYPALKNTLCFATAYFSYQNGKPLRDSNGKYRDRSGNVAVSQDLMPTYDVTEFKDVVLFIPLDELHLGAGSYDLKYRMVVYTDRGTLVAEWPVQRFNVR